VDDDHDMLVGQPCFFTDFEAGGLTQEVADAVVAWLNEGQDEAKRVGNHVQDPSVTESVSQGPQTER